MSNDETIEYKGKKRRYIVQSSYASSEGKNRLVIDVFPDPPMSLEEEVLMEIKKLNGGYNHYIPSPCDIAIIRVVERRLALKKGEV